MGERLSASGADIGETTSKKGDFALIKPYAEMGMYSAEIREALSIEHEISPSPWSINAVLTKARQSGELRQLTPEEKGDILKDQRSQSKKQALDQSVLRWLFTKTILTVDNESLSEKSVVLPQGRLEWKDTIKKLDQDGMLDDIISATKPLILRRVPLTNIVKIYKNQSIARSYKEKSFAFVYKCLEEGLIGEDLSSWRDVHAFYKLHNRSFTKDSSERIRLEVWFRVRNTTGERGMQLLLKYKELGEEIGRYWFDNSLAWEEDFIANASNINEGGYGEDPQEIFRVGAEGKLRTPIGLNDDGQIIFDTLSSRGLRTRSRGKIAEEAGSNRGPYSSLA